MNVFAPDRQWLIGRAPLVRPSAIAGPHMDQLAQHLNETIVLSVAVRRGGNRARLSEVVAPMAEGFGSA